jgi:hypothetical protein
MVQPYERKGIMDNKAFADEVFEGYPSRFRRGEKDAFLERCRAEFLAMGYGEDEVTVQGTKRNRNLVVGNAGADVLVTAHYDTPARNGVLLLLSPLVGQAWANVLMLFVLFVAFTALYYALPFDVGFFVSYITRLGLVTVLMLPLFLVKNKQNRNDNTSGVLGVIDVARRVAADVEMKEKVCFVLFDNEEWGLLGAAAFVEWRDKEFAGKKNSRVINLDCIGCGDVLLVAAKTRHEVWADVAGFMEGEGFKVVKMRSMLMFLSDHAHFRNGLQLAFVRRSVCGPLYIPKIHTGRDVVCDMGRVTGVGEAVYGYIKSNCGA